MISAFEGWNDACQAATNVIRHLVSRYDSQEVHHIDNEGFYDYQVARPMICSVQGRKRIIWPQTTFYDIAVSPSLHFLAQIAPAKLSLGGILQADVAHRRRLRCERYRHAWIHVRRLPPHQAFAA